MDIRQHNKTQYTTISNTEIIPSSFIEPNNSNNEKITRNHPFILSIYLSTFLHSMNIYIIKPTSTEYVMTLGENRSLTGLILGILTGSSVVSAFLFSFWTKSQTYIIPILVSSFCMILGNILYASAYMTNSFFVMMFGCAMTGIGGPCIINRRFVTEYTSRHLRTAGTVFLAAVGCLGAAIGPLVDMIFHNNISNGDGIGSLKVYVFLIGLVDINELNGPGYLMSFLWTLYTLITTFIFIYTSKAISTKYNHEEEIILATKLKNSLITNDIDIDSYFSEVDELPVKYSENNDTIFKTIKHSSTTTKVSLCLTFLTSVITETIQSSSPIIGYTKYNWDITKVITLNFINLIMVLPISLCIACWLSSMVKDGDMLMLLYPVAAVGTLFLIDVDGIIGMLQVSANVQWKNEDATRSLHYDTTNTNYDWLFIVDPVRYSMGNVIVYSSLQACSGILASSLSKTMSPTFSKGTYNASFLTTVIGSIGKTCGNLFIIIAGYIDMQNILNLLFIPCFFLVLCNIIILLFAAVNRKNVVSF